MIQILTFRHSFLTIPDLDKSDLAWFLPINVVPLLLFGVGYRHSLSLQIESLLEDACGMDFGLPDSAVVHYRQCPIFDRPMDRTPDTPSDQL